MQLFNILLTRLLTFAIKLPGKEFVLNVTFENAGSIIKKLTR